MADPLRLSSKHTFVFGGGARASSEYQEREGRYRKTGAAERDAEADIHHSHAEASADYQEREAEYAERGAGTREAGSAAAAADDYQTREGKHEERGKADPRPASPTAPDGRPWETRGDLLHVGVTMPEGAPAEWGEDRKAFWKAVEDNEHAAAHEHAEFKANSAKVAEFRKTNTIPEMGRIGRPPAGKNGKDLSGTALADWAKAEVKKFAQTPEGKALKDGGLVIKPHVERNSKTGQLTLYYRAQSRAEWMAESTVAMKGHFGLANELTPEEAVKVTEKFCERMAEMGLACTTAIHWKAGQHHFHFMINLRSIQADGTFAKGRHSVFRDGKPLGEWERENREFVASVQNEILRERGIDRRVEFRSDAEIAREQAADRQAEKEGVRIHVVEDDRQSRYDEIRRQRLAKAMADPGAVRNEFSQAHATFTREQVAEWMTSSDADPQEVALAAGQVIDAEGVVEVGRDFEGRAVYSTRDYLDAEAQLYADLDDLAATAAVRIEGWAVEEVLHRPEFERLSDEQQEAVREFCSPAGVSNIVGRAGVGKTTLLKAGVTAAQEAGHRVKGMSQYGNQAKKLGRETGIESKTVRAYQEAWRQLDEIDTMLATGKLTDREREKVATDLEKVRGRTEKWVAADVRDKEWMLKTGNISAKHRSFLEKRLEKLEPDRIKAGDIYVMDEAGLTGTRDAADIAARIKGAGAALRMVGDHAQHRSLDAGEPFRASVERQGAAHVETIRRQRHDAIDAVMAHDGVDLETAARRVATMERQGVEPPEAWSEKARAAGPSWQAEASMKMSSGETAEGLKDYMRAGRFSWAEDRTGAVGQVVGGYMADVDAGIAERDILAIASTNADVRSINLSIKAELAERRGAPDGPGLEIETEDNNGNPLGAERFDVGDRIAFLRNENRGTVVRNVVDAAAEFGVKNGERGTVRGFTEAGEIEVEIDPLEGENEGRRVVFHPDEYSAVALGWAVTGTKSQGESLRRAHTLIDQLATTEKMYVAGTRAEEKAMFYADRETFVDDAALLRSVDRGAGKTMASDWQVADHEREAHDRVGAYVRARAAAAEKFRTIFQESGKKEVWNHPEWSAFEATREDIKAAAQAIAADFKAHARFLARERVSRSAVEIDAGLRARTMSIGEEKIFARMKAYAAKVTEARDMWNRIKEEAGSTVAATRHPEYAAYCELRGERDAEAFIIAQDPRFRKFTRDVGVPANTILSHAEAHEERGAELDRKAKMTPAEYRIHVTVAEYKDACTEANIWRERLRDFDKNEPAPTLEEVYADIDPSDPPDREPGEILAEWQAEHARARKRLDDGLYQATRKQDAMAAKVADLADRAGARMEASRLEDGAARHDNPVAAELWAQKVNPERLALQAGRHEIHTLVARYSQARAHRLEGTANKCAADIMRGATAEQGGPKLTAAAVARAGLDWTEIRAREEAHAVSTAPAEVRDALPAARAYLDARRDAFRVQRQEAEARGVEFKDARAAADVVAAHQHTEAKAAQLATQPNAQAALDWWADRQARPGQEPKRVEVDQVQREADRHEARGLVVAYRFAEGEERHQLAAQILAATEAEKVAEGPKPVTGAIRETASEWAEIRADAEAHQLAQVPLFTRDAVPAARAFLDARREVRQLEKATAEAEGIDRAEARKRPEIVAARQRADAAALRLAHEPGAEDAMRWLHEQDVRRWGEKAAKPVTLAQVADAARRAEAAQIAQSYRQQPDPAMAWEICQRMTFERQMGGRQPTAQALHEAGLEPAEVRREGWRHANEQARAEEARQREDGDRAHETEQEWEM